MKARAGLAAAIILTLAGCGDAGGPEDQPRPTANAPVTPSPTASPTNAPPVADSVCGADRLARFLNLLPTSTAKAEIAGTVGERTIRYIEHGQAIDADFVPNRLNAELGVDGRIKRFYCG